METFKKLATVYSPIEADIVKSLLSENGIICEIRPASGAFVINAYLGTNCLPHDIYVFQEDFNAAHALLDGTPADMQ